MLYPGNLIAAAGVLRRGKVKGDVESWKPVKVVLPAFTAVAKLRSDGVEAAAVCYHFDSARPFFGIGFRNSLRLMNAM